MHLKSNVKNASFAFMGGIFATLLLIFAVSSETASYRVATARMCSDAVNGNLAVKESHGFPMAALESEGNGCIGINLRIMPLGLIVNILLLSAIFYVVIMVARKYT